VLIVESLRLKVEVGGASLSFPFLLVVVTTVGGRTVLGALVLAAVDVVCRGEGRGGVDDDDAPVRSEPLGGDGEMETGPVTTAGDRVRLGTGIGVATATDAEDFAASLVLTGTGLISTGMALVEVDDDEEVGTESRYQHPE